jgi:hypothetical protein
MTTQKLAIAVGASLAAGFALAALTLSSTESDGTDVGVATGFDDSADIRERLKALEIAVNSEREARQLLEEEILVLYEQLDSMSRSTQDAIGSVVAEELRESEVERQRLLEQVQETQPSAEERRRDGLIAAGFSAARANWIIQRESELRMEAMQERYDAMRAGEPLSPMMRGNAERKLREDLGDPQYEMYLAANNRPTAIGIGTVFESSPAATAGLQPGDEITHYDGARVFSTFDLTRQTMEGDAGENVVVNITRDGVPMQIVMPRGPLGINTGRRR